MYSFVLCRARLLVRRSVYRKVSKVYGTGGDYKYFEIIPFTVGGGTKSYTVHFNIPWQNTVNMNTVFQLKEYYNGMYQICIFIIYAHMLICCLGRFFPFAFSSSSYSSNILPYLLMVEMYRWHTINVPFIQVQLGVQSIQKS